MNNEQSELSSFTLLVTEQCNLRCNYCYISRRPLAMSAGTARRAVDFAFEQPPDSKCDGMLSFCFFGGEPLLADSIIRETCEYARQRSGQTGRPVHFSMTTNGTMLDEKRAELIHRYHIKTKVSLDGVADAQDMHRRLPNGEGSFAQILRHFKRIQNLPGLSIRLTVTPQNVHLLAASLRWMVETRLANITFSPVVEAAWDERSLEQLLDAYETLHRLQSAGVLNSRVRNLTRDRHRMTKARGREFGCGAAVSMVAVSTEGALYPCHRFIGYSRKAEKFQLGHVATGIDRAARRRHMDDNRIAHMEGCGEGLYLKEEHASGCATCKLLPVCLCGCMAINTFVTGDARRPPPINRILSQIAAASCLSEIETDTQAKKRG